MYLSQETQKTIFEPFYLVLHGNKLWKSPLQSILYPSFFLHEKAI